MKLKASRFNVYRPHGDRTLVYNCLSGRWTFVAPDNAAHLEDGQPDLMGKEDLERVVDVEAAVIEELDELQRYRHAYLGVNHDLTQFRVVALLTYRCNLRCPYCFEGPVESGERMSDELLDRLISAVETHCAQNETRRLGVMLFGGEPMLEVEKGRKLLGTLSDWAKQHRVAFQGVMSTNAVLCTPERLDRVAPFLKLVQVAFDGPRRIHDTLRIGANGKPTYDQVIAGIRQLVDRGIRVHVRVQVTEPAQVTELLHDLEEQGLVGHPAIRFAIAVRQQFSRWKCEQDGATIDGDSDMARELRLLAPDLLPLAIPSPQFLACVTGGNFLCVTPTGDLYKCITSIDQPECRMGRVEKHGRFSFNDRFHEYRVRDPLSFPECRECALLPLCGGGCPNSAFQAHGSYDHAWCSNTREVLLGKIDNVTKLRRRRMMPLLDPAARKRR